MPPQRDSKGRFIKTDLVLDPSGWNKGLKEAGDNVNGFVKDVNKANKKLDSLATRTAKNFGGKVAGAVKKVGGELKDLAGQARRAANDVARLGLELGLAAAAGAIGIAINLSTQAADAEEVFSKFSAVFKDLSGENASFVKDLSQSAKRSTVELSATMAQFQDTFVPLGFARDEAAKLSRQLTTLSVDVASFNNIADAEAAEAFTSAMVGNHEAVRKFGIVITEATLKNELLRMGITTSVAATDQMTKATARLNIIMAATSDAQGDAARTSNSFTNQLKAVKGVVEELSIEFGTKLNLAIVKAAGAAGGFETLEGAVRLVLEATVEAVKIMVEFGLDAVNAFQDAVKEAGGMRVVLAEMKVRFAEISKVVHTFRTVALTVFEAVRAGGEIMIAGLVSGFVGLVHGVGKYTALMGMLGKIPKAARDAGVEMMQWARANAHTTDESTVLIESLGRLQNQMAKLPDVVMDSEATLVRYREELKNVKAEVAFAKTEAGQFATAITEIGSSIEDVIDMTSDYNIETVKLRTAVSQTTLTFTEADRKARDLAIAQNDAATAAHTNATATDRQTTAMLRTASAANVAALAIGRYQLAANPNLSQGQRNAILNPGQFIGSRSNRVRNPGQGFRAGGLSRGASGGHTERLHGDEFVVNARQTRRNLGLLRSINSGASDSGAVTAASQGPRASTSKTVNLNMPLNVQMVGSGMSDEVLEQRVLRIMERSTRHGGRIAGAL